MAELAKVPRGLWSRTYQDPTNNVPLTPSHASTTPGQTPYDLNPGEVTPTPARASTVGELQASGTPYGYIAAANGRTAKFEGTPQIPQAGQEGGFSGGGFGLQAAAPVMPAAPVASGEQVTPAKPSNIQTEVITPDTSDNSIGGMFTRGLQSREARTYNTINSTNAQNAIAARGQDVTLAGTNAAAVGAANRTQVEAQGLANQVPGQQAAANAAEASAGRAQAESRKLGEANATKRKVAELTAQLNDESLTPEKRRAIQTQINNLSGIRTEDKTKYGVTVDPLSGEANPYSVGPGGFKNLLTPEQRLSRSTKGLNDAQLNELKTSLADNPNPSMEDIERKAAELRRSR